MEGNIAENPLFCHEANPADHCSIGEDSPCAPEHNSQCGLTGDCGVGCPESPAAVNSPEPAATLPGGLRLVVSSPNRSGLSLRPSIPDACAG